MTVADLCKIAVIECQKEFRERGLESVPIPIIRYDSFCFDVKPNEEKEAKEAIQKALIERTIPADMRFDVNFETSMTDIYT
jgi:DNA polymerase I-like protein with 3'-5' exonuclease and polymerase domains